MKKTLLAAALIGTIGIAGVQIASAHNDFGGNYGGYCGNYSTQDRGFSEQDSKAYEKFLDDTGTIRKEIAVKQSELNALYRQDNPDEKKVAALTGELYDLQNQINQKARTAGLSNPGYGPGMMWGTGSGRGRNMMKW